MLLETGQVIESKYRITRLIGTGGMGAVYEGENVLIRRRVAIKVLHADSTGNSDIIRRFEREAQAAGEIGNDHILEVLDLGSLPNGDRFMVMEYLDGETLAQRIERYGRLTPTQVAPIASQFLTALVSAHAAGIIHRDLKPENIFILRSKAGRADFVKLIDFGVSKFSRPFKEGEHRMTRANAVLGTPCYMSPEQARGASETDVRSDIYSCGVMLFEAVTGRLPFEGDTFNDLMFKIALEDAPNVASVVPDLDPEFAAIIMRAIARDPGARFPSALEFSTTLDVWMQKNKLTDSLSLGAGAERTPAPARVSIDRGLPTMSLEEDPRASAADKTRTNGSWASQSDSGVKEPRRSRAVPLVIGSVAAVAALAIGIGVTTRARPAAHPAAAVAPSEPAQALAPSLPAPPPTVVASAAEAPQTLTPISSSDIAPSSAPASHKAAAPPAAAPRPAAQPPSSHPKPKPAGGSGGFDFGY